MAGIYAIAQTAEVALAAATVKSVVQIRAAANHRVRILGWGVFFDGVSTTAEPVQCELVRQTTDGTWTSLTPVALKPTAESLQTTAFHTATVEPTLGDILDSVEVHPQQGFEKIYPLGQEPEVAGSGRVAIRCTAPAIVNVRAKIVYEE